MIFNAISGSSAQLPVTPIGGHKMYYALDDIYHASGANNRSLKKPLKYMPYRTLELL